QQLPARLQHAVELPQADYGPGNRAERAYRHHGIEAGLRERQLTHVQHAEFEGALVGGRFLRRALQHFRADVDGDDVLTGREELEIIARPDGDHERGAADLAEQPALVWPESPVIAPGEKVKGAASLIPLALRLCVHDTNSRLSPRRQ